MEGPSQPLATQQSHKDTINVLVVGETQQGKSTLIKHVTKYAGLTNVDIPIGNGSLSCTKTVEEYRMTVIPRAYQLVDHEGTPIATDDFEVLADLRNVEAKVIELPEADALPSIDFNFIDTPGLNDSSGDDLVNMGRFVGRASELGHINALVYIRNVEEPYSRSFQQFFGYLQRCFPSFSQGFIIVHSHFTTRKVGEFLNDKVNLAALRQEAFQKTMDASLEHIFMDNLPSRFSPYARLRSLNEMCRFLRHLASQQPMPCEGFRMLKMPSMYNIDIHVRNALNELKISLQRDQRREESISNVFTKTNTFNQLEISRSMAKITLLKAKIDDLVNGPDVLLGTRSCVEGYTIWGSLVRERRLYLPERELEYMSDFDITKVTKSSRGCRWTNEFRQGGIWRGTLAASALRDLNGTVTFYTTSVHRHKDTIKLLRERVQEIEDSIASYESSMKISGATAEFDENVARLGRDLEKVDNVLQAVTSEEVCMSLWPRLKAFYRAESGLSRHQISAFVKVYDEDVANLLWN